MSAPAAGECLELSAAPGREGLLLPNFLLVGAMKCGSTSLYHYLSQHPEIFTSRKRELKYFISDPRVHEWTGPGDAEWAAKIPASLEAYARNFDGSEGYRAVGEVTREYLFIPWCATKIKAALPDVRILAILRDPSKRAFSQHLMWVREGREPIASFMDAVRAEQTRVASGWGPYWEYVERGMYYKQLKRYYDLFDPSAIKVVLLEDLYSDPETTMAEVFAFLGVDPSFRPSTDTAHNTGFAPRSLALTRFLRKGHPLRIALGPFLPRRLKDRAMTALESANRQAPPKLAPEERAYLVGIYREDILRLGDLLQRDLSPWLAA